MATSQDNTNTAENVKIGIIDSITNPRPLIDEEIEFNIDETRDLTASNGENQSMHGFDVFEVLWWFVDEETPFSFYRVQDKNGTMKPATVMDAMEIAQKDGCDLVNISIGLNEPFCDKEGHFGLCEMTDYIAKKGVIPVVAMGNKTDKSRKARCPGKSNHAISVGGIVTHCEARGGECSNTLNGTYWYKTEATEEFNEHPTFNTSYCGYRDCRNKGNRFTCDRYQEEKLWGHNVDFGEIEPDTLAPIIKPLEQDIGMYLNCGTSYATPIVTGLIASIISELSYLDIELDASDLQKGLNKTNRELNGGIQEFAKSGIGVINQAELMSHFLDELGCH